MKTTIAELDKKEILSIIKKSLKNNKKDWEIGTRRAFNENIGVSLWKRNGLYFFRPEVNIISGRLVPEIDFREAKREIIKQENFELSFSERLDLYLTYILNLKPEKTFIILPNIIISIFLEFISFVPNLIIKWTTIKKVKKKYKLLMYKSTYREIRLNKIKK